MAQDGAAKKKSAAAAALAKAKAGAKKDDGHKAAPVEKTQVVYEVKPAHAGQDMAALEAKIRETKLEGISWGEQFKVVDVAFGIQKLVIQFVMVGELNGLQEVEDAVRCGSMFASLCSAWVQLLRQRVTLHTHAFPCCFRCRSWRSTRPRPPTPMRMMMSSTWCLQLTCAR